MSMKQITDFLKGILRPHGCGKTKQLLFEYVEGELPAETEARLAKHLGNCPPCLKYVESYRHTIEVTHHHGLPEEPMPDALKQKLCEFIRQNPDLK